MIASLLLASVVLAGPSDTDPLAARIQLADGENYRGETVQLYDVDGDGRLDLAYGVRRADGVREVRVHLRRPAGEQPIFAVQPDRRIEFDRRAVAFAFADLYSEPGAELLMLFPDVVVAWIADVAEDQRYRKICDSRLLWQPAVPESLYAWQAGVRDLDGDGQVDLLIPQRVGYRVLLTRRNAEETTFASHDLVVPALRQTRKRDQFERLGREGDSEGGRFDVRLLEDGARQAAPTLDVELDLPTPHFEDVDGDGVLDLLAMRGFDVHVWLQRAAEAAPAFRAEPDFTRSLPPRLDELIDPAFRAAALQGDGDGRADLVVTVSRVRGGDQTSAVEVFRGQREGLTDSGADWFSRAGGRADQRLRFPGLVVLTRYDDVDQDGRRDLVIGRLRTDLLRSLAGGGKKVDVRLSVFRGGPNGFAEKPMLSHDEELRGEDLRAQRGGSGAFFADIDGDGVRDLLLRTGKQRFSVRRVKRRGNDSLAVGDSVFDQQIAERTRFVFAPDGRAMLIAVEPDQMRCFAWGAER